MIDGYLDEGGVHDQAKVCVIAGYFAGRGKWKKFEDDWKAVLRDFKVPIEEFHAKDIYPKPKDFFHPRLGEWGGNIVAFRNGVADVIANHPKIHPIAAGIVVDDFYSFPDDARRYFTGATVRRGELVTSGCPNKPYFVPFQRCVVQICDYAPVGSRADFFFGLDRPFAEYARHLFDGMKVSDIRADEFPEFKVEWKDRLGISKFPLAKETPQLQAADFLTCLTYHHMLDCGPQVVTTEPSPLLAKCISNRRTMEDFYFLNRFNLDVGLDMADEFFQMLHEAGYQ
jgi:hypothetical protein